MNIHVKNFFNKNRSNLISILMAVVLICCLVGPLWSYHSAQTKEYGEEVFTLTGRPVYYSFNKIQEYKSDPYGFNGAYRGEIIAAFLCVIFTIAAFALSVANLFLLGKTEYLLKLITSACFLVVMTAAMAIMILVGGQIHSLEKNYGVYGFLVGPGPITCFVFSFLAFAANMGLLTTRLDGWALKIALHVKHKEEKERLAEGYVDDDLA